MPQRRRLVHLPGGNRDLGHPAGQQQHPTAMPRRPRGSIRKYTGFHARHGARTRHPGHARHRHGSADPLHPGQLQQHDRHTERQGAGAAGLQRNQAHRTACDRSGLRHSDGHGALLRDTRTLAGRKRGVSMRHHQLCHHVRQEAVVPVRRGVVPQLLAGHGQRNDLGGDRVHHSQRRVRRVAVWLHARGLRRLGWGWVCDWILQSPVRSEAAGVVGLPVSQPGGSHQ